MQLTPHTARRLAASLLASVAVFVVAAPAQARPDGHQPQLRAQQDSSDAFMRHFRNEQYRADRIGIPNVVVPYLSHGMVESPQVVSYLSQGYGITRSVGALPLRNEADGFQPQLRGGEPVGVGTGIDWETAGVAAGTAGLVALLAATALIASRRQRRLQGA